MKKCLALLSVVFSQLLPQQQCCYPKQFVQKKVHPDHRDDNSDEEKNIVPKVDEKAQQKIILDRLAKYSTSNPILLNVSDRQLVDADMVVQKIKASLWEFAKNLKIEVQQFHSIDSNAVEGNITLAFTFNGTKLVNPQTNKTTFAFVFTLANLRNLWTITNHLQSNPLIKLSNLGINFSGNEVLFGELVKILLQVPILDNFLPREIPKNFTDDPNWTLWKENLKEILKLPVIGEYFKKNFNKTWNYNWVLINPEIKLSIRYVEVLENLLPVLINFRNFINERRETQGTDNIFLFLIQYLFEKPKNISGDNFTKTNTNIKGYKNKILTFETNLQHILHNVFEGWKSESGQYSPVKSAISMSVAVSVWSITIKYIEADGEWWQPTVYDQSILNVFTIAEIKRLFNQIITFDFNSQLKLNITALPVIKSKEVSVDFAPAIAKLLSPLVQKSAGAKTKDPNLLNETILEWKKGQLQFEYQTLNDKAWMVAKGIDDLMSATDLRVKLVNTEANIYQKTAAEQAIARTQNQRLEEINMLQDPKQKKAKQAADQKLRIEENKQLQALSKDPTYITCKDFELNLLLDISSKILTQS